VTHTPNKILEGSHVWREVIFFRRETLLTWVGIHRDTFVQVDRDLDENLGGETVEGVGRR
jgi:hypothetical protein